MYTGRTANATGIFVTEVWRKNFNCTLETQIQWNAGRRQPIYYSEKGNGIGMTQPLFLSTSSCKTFLLWWLGNIERCISCNRCDPPL